MVTTNLYKYYKIILKISNLNSIKYYKLYKMSEIEDILKNTENDIMSCLENENNPPDQSDLSNSNGDSDMIDLSKIYKNKYKSHIEWKR